MPRLSYLCFVFILNSRSVPVWLWLNNGNSCLGHTQRYMKRDIDYRAARTRVFRSRVCWNWAGDRVQNGLDRLVELGDWRMVRSPTSQPAIQPDPRPQTSLRRSETETRREVRCCNDHDGDDGASGEGGACWWSLELPMMMMMMRCSTRRAYIYRHHHPHLNPRAPRGVLSAPEDEEVAKAMHGTYRSGQNK